MPSKDPEVLARAQKNWRKKNPDYLRKWRAENPDRIAKYTEGSYERRKAQYREYYHRNRDKIRAAQKARQKAHPEKSAERQMMAKFGITLAQKEQMWIDQHKCCRICWSEISLLGAHIDHIPGTEPKIVRALLCVKCNTGLGSFCDRSDLLTRAASYLALFTPNTEA